MVVAPCTRVDPLLWTWLTVCAEEYRKASGDPAPRGYNLDRVREHWRLGGVKMMLWVLADGEVARGYAITEVVDGPAGRICYIPEAYIQPSCRRHGVVLNAMICFEGWAKAHRCAAIKFSTFRSGRAYARLLERAGWRRGETVFVKPLEAMPDGQP